MQTSLESCLYDYIHTRGNKERTCLTPPLCSSLLLVHNVQLPIGTEDTIH